MRKLLLWLARNKMKKLIKNNTLVYQGDDKISVKGKNGKVINETTTQLANELMGGTDKEKEALARAGIRSSDIANIIREEFKKSGKVDKEKAGGLNFKVLNKVQDKMVERQRTAMLNKVKSKIIKLIKDKRLEYLKDGRISYKENNGKMWMGNGAEIAEVLLDKSGRSQMAVLGIFEKDIAEIIKNKGK